MIFLTAQPSNQYFFWQLELQVRNLRNIGVPPESIHILLTTITEEGSKSLSLFLKNNGHLCKIFFYTDTRAERDYPSSIRPHIISKHFERHRFMEKETIFYYDSDVLLKRQIDGSLVEDDICYVSDTRSYIGSEYIVNEGSENLLRNMAEVIGIDMDKVLELDLNAGGAQYILKGMDSSIWKKIENDSANLYSTIKSHNYILFKKAFKTNKNLKEEEIGMDPWCADMWALLWNLHLLDKTVKIHKELDFLWPDDDISQWGDKIILHYTGFKNPSEDIFDKTKYKDDPPWFDKRLYKLSDKSCSHVVFEAIQRRKEEIQIDLPNIDKLSIILNTPDIDDKAVEQFLKIDSFYRKHLNISIYLKDENCMFCTWSNEVKKLITITSKEFMEFFKNSTNAFLVSQLDVLLDPMDILMISERINLKHSYHIETSVFKVCPLLIDLFFHRLNLDVFRSNKGKFDTLRTINEPICVVDYNTPFNKPNTDYYIGSGQSSQRIELNHEAYVL